MGALFLLRPLAYAQRGREGVRVGRGGAGKPGAGVARTKGAVSEGSEGGSIVRIRTQHNKLCLFRKSDIPYLGMTNFRHQVISFIRYPFATPLFVSPICVLSPVCAPPPFQTDKGCKR